MDFETWLHSLPGSPTPSIAAKRSKLQGPTLIRHAQRGRSTADNIIQIARAYEVSPIDALVDTGFLDADEVASEKVSLKRAFAQASMADALQLLVDKLNDSNLFEGTFTVDDIEAEASAAVRSLPTPNVDPAPYDDDALIDAINSGQAQVAAQESTEPLDEEYT
ncbi:XRE family transcriptional regulator [Corynebacterium hylobatis]|uniref:XRE family transcriptional regulator n=1 Tax=Corynebacterium hylobatis TaxID=1859290 RepID=A0A430HVK2_9CORY|nr:XRE family transcriptional regulator [Corynebacterium hylobatis]RSZ61512.1 XRE family transcriptional regulator [Corynebacterium hylobatis]